MKRVALLFVGFAACAQAAGDGGSDAPIGPPIDAPHNMDAPHGDAPRTIDAPGIDGPIDGPIVIDAAIDAPIDTPKPIDAAIDAPKLIDAAIDAPHIDAPRIDACMPTTGSGDLLLNPSFDLSPVGVDWTQTKTSGESALITSSGYYLPLDDPYDVNLGQKINTSDYVEQSVVVPAGTTSLELTGNFALETDDLTSSPYDYAYVYILNAGGATFATALELDNTSSYAGTGYWYTFTYTFSSAQIAALADTTITVELHSTNDFSGVTSFDFDQFALNATYTVPCP